MPAVARIDPKTVFTPQEWAPLARRSSWRGLACVAHAWALIVLGGALFILWLNPLTFVLAIAYRRAAIGSQRKSSDPRCLRRQS